jgi:hypothetical protein
MARRSKRLRKTGSVCGQNYRDINDLGPFCGTTSDRTPFRRMLARSIGSIATFGRTDTRCVSSQCPLIGAPLWKSPALIAHSRAFGRFREKACQMNFADARVQSAPWSTLSWGVFIPAVFVGNVVLAIFAWFVVEWITKLILI